jgi:hypothetical protein
MGNSSGHLTQGFPRCGCAADSKIFLRLEDILMGLVKEPTGIDLVVYPSTLTANDKQRISAIIAEYKQTRKLPAMENPHRHTSKNMATTNWKRSPKKLELAVRSLEADEHRVCVRYAFGITGSLNLYGFGLLHF